MNFSSEWRDYTNACWAANWHRLFAGDPSDARGKMGWPGRFADALTNATEVFNYYSSGDDVFAETASMPSLLEGARTWHLNWFLWVIPYPTVGLTFENHCWQKQEVLKGMATPALSWRGRFAGISNAVNCYSETEDVVGNPRELTVSLTRADWAIRQSSWVAQEALKGTSVLNAINIWPWSHIGCEGGWGRSAHYPLWCASGSTLGLSDLAREDVIGNPLFTPFRNETERMSSTNLFAVMDAAATPQLRARFLADAIPAESHAAGANALDVRANIVNTRMDQDVRDGGYMSNYDRWPGNRRETVNETERLLWHHSDFKNLAYFFVYSLFDKIANKTKE